MQNDMAQTCHAQVYQVMKREVLALRQCSIVVHSFLKSSFSKGELIIKTASICMAGTYNSILFQFFFLVIVMNFIKNELKEAFLEMQ